MGDPAANKLIALSQALDNKEWRHVKLYLSRIPTSLSKQASANALAASLDLVRGASNALAEACSFTTAFETSFETRRALHRAGACEWAIAALRGFATVRSIVSSVSTVLGLLGLDGEGRCRVGKLGAVDELTKLWHRHLDCVQIVSALVSLCPGHIDNVSRTMRQRALVAGMKVLSDNNSLTNPQLVGQTLTLLGMCSICTPDNQNEGKRLVPVILDVLERLNAGEDDLIDTAKHAILALANVGDCWMKEGTGYDVAEPNRVCSVIIESWTKGKSSADIALASSRALMALLSSHAAVKIALTNHRDTLLSLTSETRHLSSTILALHTEVRPALEPDAQPSAVKGRRNPRRHASSLESEGGPSTGLSIPQRSRKKLKKSKTSAAENKSVELSSPVASNPVPPAPSCEIIDLVSSSDDDADSMPLVRRASGAGALGKRKRGCDAQNENTESVRTKSPGSPPECAQTRPLRKNGTIGMFQYQLSSSATQDVELDSSPVTIKGTPPKPRPRRQRRASYKLKQLESAYSDMDPDESQGTQNVRSRRNRQTEHSFKYRQVV